MSPSHARPAAERFGLSVALSTPFQQDARPDLQRLAGHATWCLQNGVKSITLFGTTGEGASIGLGERERMIGALGGVGIGTDRIISGVAAASLEEAAAQARLALSGGCRGLLLAPPFYFKAVSDEGLFQWFSRLFERVPGIRDVILYHIPSVTAVGISPALIGRLRQAFPGVVTGVKDSSGDGANTEALLASHGDLAILVGDERQLAGAVRKGAQGTICGTANFVPELVGPAANEGRDDPRLNAVVDLICSVPVMAAVKAMIAHRTGDAGWLATCPPLEALTPNQVQALAAQFDDIMKAQAA